MLSQVTFPITIKPTHKQIQQHTCEEKISLICQQTLPSFKHKHKHTYHQQSTHLLSHRDAHFLYTTTTTTLKRAYITHYLTFTPHRHTCCHKIPLINTHFFFGHDLESRSREETRGTLEEQYNTGIVVLALPWNTRSKLHQLTLTNLQKNNDVLYCDVRAFVSR